jgi:predicted ATPase
MLSNLSLENFKPWKRVADMRLAPITGLFGSNSSGKTSILQLLLMLKQSVESSDRNQVLNLGNQMSLVELGTMPDIAYNHTRPGSLQWKLSWTLPAELKIQDPTDRPLAVLFKDDKIAFACEVIEDKSGLLRVEQMSYWFAKQEFRYQWRAVLAYELTAEGPGGFELKRSSGYPEYLPPPVKCYGFPDQVKSYYQNAGFLADLALETAKFFENVYYLGPLREYPKRQYLWGGFGPADVGTRGEKVVEALLASRQGKDRTRLGKGKARHTVEECAAHWLKELHLIHDFQVQLLEEKGLLYQVFVKKSADSSPVLITDVGFGISQILPVIVLCYYVPTGSTIILEQPEIHLHPAVQAGLADVLINAVQVRDVQIIVESHSEHLLRRLQRRIAEEKLKADEVALYFCEYRKDQSELVPLEVDTLGNIKNWPKDFFGDEVGELAEMTRAQMQRMRSPA